MHPTAISALEEQAAQRDARRHPLAKRVLAVFLLAGLAAGVDAFFIEPDWIEVTHHTVPASLHPPLKIAHLTDLHTRGLGRRERRLLALLEEEKPDLIAITGDTLAGNGTPLETRALLSRLRAPLGVWLVRGNWENWRPNPREREFYASLGIHFLLNEAAPARDGLWVIGLDDSSSGSPSLHRALRSVPPGAFTIALFHSPDYFDEVSGRCALVLAGHTHGGQVRIPFIRPFWLPRGSGRFLEGIYAGSSTIMYVSRGIGVSIVPLRFFCRPELAILTVGS